MSPRTPGRRRLAVALAAGTAVATATAGVVPAAAVAAVPPTPGAAPAAALLRAPGVLPGGTPLQAGSYVVTLKEPAVATYGGGVAGLAATAPAPEQTLATRSDDVQRYRAHLAQRQDAVLSAAGVTPTHRYTVALNGFSARLSAQQAARLAADRSVLSVVPDTVRTVDTTLTPEVLGLSGPSGVWAGLGGRDQAGTGVVVGVIDTGIQPENPMFRGAPVTARSGSRPGDTYLSPDGGIDVVKGDGGIFEGTCQTGPKFTRSECNDTIVSARWFGASFLAADPPLEEFEQLSPRDGDGHGSHTASTAAGRSVADLRISGRSFGRATGMAPAAKLAVYKGCWNLLEPAQDGCSTADLVEAIDQAVQDGVDVINYSIGGGGQDVATDPIELAFLSAASAGIFVSGSAGNSGPTPATVDKNVPWVTSVAATTVHRFESTVELGNGRRLRGASLFGSRLPATAAVLAKDAGRAGTPVAEAAQCFLGSLDPAEVRGKVVVCDRGTVDRVEKSAAVALAGGVGMVLLNVTTGGTSADKHSIPSVHLEADVREQVLGYFAADRTPTIALLSGDQTALPPTPVPVVAGFSSRGPSLTTGGDLIKPDIAAPGVDVLAAVAPGPHGGDRFDALSGTSMAAPHVAGLAALILQSRPTWSPMRVKSTMMTTAYDTRNPDGTANTDPFAQGAGFVDPTRFASPGLLYDSGVRDFLGFMEGLGVDTGTGVRAIDPSDANQPSIAVGELAGTQTVTRRVTAHTPGLYRATASIPGVAVTVSPSVLNFASRGEVKEFTVTFRRTTAALDTTATGFLTWRGADLTVRSPLAVTPVALSAPAEVTGTGRSGSTSYEVVPGATGPLPLDLAGLVAGRVTDDAVAVGPFAPTPTGDAANKVYRVDVPAGTRHARLDLVAADQGDDLDLFLIDPAFTTILALSATGAASERIDVEDPPAGRYYVVVNGFGARNGSTAAFSLRTFAVPDRDLGNATVSPDPVPGRQGAPATVTVRWQDLAAGRPYLGVVDYVGTGRETLVQIG